MKEFISLYPNNPKVLSPEDYTYLDTGYGNRYGKSGNDRVYLTWTHMATFEPEEFSIDPTILGGETALWSEMVTPHSLETKVFPRIAVFSDVFWGPKKVEAIDWHDLAVSIVQYKNYMVKLGFEATRVTSRWCEEHIDEVYTIIESASNEENLDYKSVAEAFARFFN